MKKIIFCSLVILMTTAFNIKAQENKSILNFGVGFFNGIGGNISYDHNIKKINDNFALTVGGYLGLQRGDGYALTGSNSKYEWDYKWILSPRIGCAYSINKRFELFATIMPGFLIDDKHESDKKYCFFPGIAAGGRVQLFKNLFFFTEVGYNISILNAGIGLKF